MAIYYTTTCPHCKRIHERRKDNKTPYGTPFKTCRSCGNVFIDTNYIEIGLMDDKDIKERSFSWGAPILIILGIPIFIASWIEVFSLGVLFGLGMAALGIYNIIYNIKWKPEEDPELQKMIQESKNRLSDPRYVIALWKTGCYVTPEIVAWAKKELGTNNPQVDTYAVAKTNESQIPT